MGWGGAAEGSGPGDPVVPGVMEPGSPELGQASRSLDGRAVRRGPPGDLCSQRGGGDVERGGAKGTGKVFEEQKQWPILCRPAWPER